MNSHVCRRLVLLLDGTWNEDVEDQPASNIVYLRERLFWGLQTRRRIGAKADQEEFEKLPDDIKKKAVRAVVFDGFEYIVCYHRGVGTGPLWDRIKGGIFGSGLEQNIRQAYKFLSCWFRPGDEIFVFGFSRGAFTARSLCGYLRAVGLLKSEYCTEENEARAWSYYRTAPADRLSADWLFFRQPDNRPELALVHDERSTRVRALCVFDTVGARGIPASRFRRFNRSRYEFHDTDISSVVDIRLHALAIDEPRSAFQPTLWTKPKFEILDGRRSPTEQAWFPGAHSDIGGGYVKWNHNERGLSHLAISWMLQRLEYHLVHTPPAEAVPMPQKLAVPPNPKAPIPFYTDDLFDRNGQTPIIKGEVQELALSATQHEPGMLWRMAIWRDPRRLINQIEPKETKGVRAEGRVPFADPIGETIHVSAFKRLKSCQQKGNRTKWWLRRFHKEHTFYYPASLISLIPYIAATYLKMHRINTPWNNKSLVGEIFSWREIKVMDWNGQPFDPAEERDVERLFEILPKPAEIGMRAMPSEMRHMDSYIQRVRSAGGPTDGFLKSA